MKVQQVTGPVMAKGVEDTSFYVYNRLVSLNEVGGNPGQFGCSLESFHGINRRHCERWSHTLLATSTHDTKRSEDVRARINVLSEIPKEWHLAITRWSRMNARHKTLVDGELAPDRNDEYFLYQTLLGVWPACELSAGRLASLRERLATYMLKATKESKVHTSWINPNEAYDAAVQYFVQALLADGKKNRFLRHFATMQELVSFHGRLNALSQLLLKLTSPGVPDIYQGTELWDDSLVDPDNRRPVDFQMRRSILADLKERLEASPEPTRTLRELLESEDAGSTKLYLTWKILNYRRANPGLFSTGSYVPLEASGDHQNHVCAFARILGDQAILVAAPRFTVQLMAGQRGLPLGDSVWQDSCLAIPSDFLSYRYRNVVTGENLCVCHSQQKSGLPLALVFQSFPFALLERVIPD